MKKIIIFLTVLLGLLVHKVQAQNDCVSKKFSANYEEMVQAREAYDPKANLKVVDPFDVGLVSVTSTYLSVAESASNLLEFCIVMNSKTYGDSDEAKTLLWKKFDNQIENVFTNISIHYKIVPFDSLTLIYGAMRMNITCKKDVQDLSFEELCVLTYSILGFNENKKHEQPMTKETIALYQVCYKRMKELGKLSGCPDKIMIVESIPVSLK